MGALVARRAVGLHGGHQGATDARHVDALAGLGGRGDQVARAAGHAAEVAGSRQRHEDDPLAEVTPQGQPVDVTIDCATRDHLVKLLRGEINPVVANLRGFASQRGDRAFGATVMLGLRAGSPFVHTPFDGKDR